MATYKSGYKRSNSDRFLTYSIVGFGVVIVSLILGLIIFNIVHEEVTYDSFDHITSFYNITSQDEDEYLVYYYSENCGYCNEIKQKVLNFADKNNANVKVYFLDATQATGTTLPIADPNTGETMDGTPSLISVVNGTIVQMSPGYIEVLNTLEEINDGTNAYIN